MPKGKDMKMENCDCKCHSHGWRGAVMLLVGALVLLNAYYMWLSWPIFIGILIVLKGLKVLVMPRCNCCDKK